MRRLTFYFLLCAILMGCKLMTTTCSAQGTSINNTGIPADSSAILDVSSDDKGVLIPRLSTAQQAAIVSPASGLLIYNTTTGCFEFYNGNNWTSLCDSAVTGYGLVDSCGIPDMLPKIDTNPNTLVCSQVYDNTISVGVNTVTPNPYARFQVVSTTQGMLIPTVTSDQRLAISGLSQADKGLQVYDTDKHWFFYWTGTRWCPYGAYNDTLTFLGAF